VIDAVLELTEAEGLGALTIDAIASKAGVSKASIYRRWSSKEDVVVDAMVSLVGEVPFPDTGDIRADLTSLITSLGRFMSSARAGSVFPWMIGEVGCGSEVGRRYSESVIAPKRKMIGSLLAGAKERGDLRSDLDIETAVDMLIGPVLVRKVMGSSRLGEKGWVPGLIDALLDGWRPR
jgi:AcrR family transcriptional regulator